MSCPLSPYCSRFPEELLRVLTFGDMSQVKAVLEDDNEDDSLEFGQAQVGYIRFSKVKLDFGYIFLFLIAESCFFLIIVEETGASLIRLNYKNHEVTPT